MNYQPTIDYDEHSHEYTVGILISWICKPDVNGGITIPYHLVGHVSDPYSYSSKLLQS